MRINNSPIATQNPDTNFKAKFLYNNTLKQISEKAAELGQLENLNQARKNISMQDNNIGLLVDIGENNGKSFVSFSKYIPRKKVKSPKTFDDFKLAKTETFEACRHCNPIEFALNKILKLGNDAPNNNMYKKIIMED